MYTRNTINTKIQWIVVVLALVLGIGLFTQQATASNNASPQAKRLGKVKNIQIEQMVETGQIRMAWKKPKGAKKIRVQVKQGSTSIYAIAKTKKKLAKFNDTLLTHDQTYTFRFKALKTAQRKASKWRKVSYTFQDLDNDDDRIADDVDTDDDNDGILDADDDYPLDHDNDGTEDYLDDDDDNDLVEDLEDDNLYDHDNDGTPDVDDADDDGDGVLDVDEAPGQQFDEDNDGTPDNEDEDFVPDAPDPEINVVTISSTGFTNGSPTIRVNDYVQWVNKDELADHTIVANDQSWSSQPLQFQSTYARQFTSVGTYDYYDPNFSNTFTGTITVTETGE